MNKINRILLGVLGVQVLLVLFFNLRGEDTSIGKLEPVLADVAADKVERIRVFDATVKSEEGEQASEGEKAKPGEPSIDLVKKNGAWVLASHFDYPVDAQKITDLLDKIAGMQSRGAIASGKARQKQLEVADDSYQRKVVLTQAGKESVFYLGASAGSRHTSVRVGGADDVHGITGLTASGVGARASAWVETGYLDVEADKVESVDLVNASGNFHFERAASGDGWQASVGGQPVTPAAGMELNKGEIEKIVNRASKIFLSQPGDPKRTIDKPLATVTLHLKAEQAVPAAPAANAGEAESTVEEAGEDRVIEIAAADKKDSYYVREKGRAQAALVDALSVTDLAELTRDRLVQKIGEKKDEAGGEPGELPLEGGLPPGMDPSQMVGP